MDRKTALVTGSAKGIGRSIALKLADKGYDIIVNAKSIRPDFNGETVYDVQRLVEEKGRKAYICIADISCPDGRQKILDCVDEIGRVDILVNNAGIEPPGKDVLEVTGEDLDLVLSTNFYGPFALTQQIAKRMIAWKSSGVIEQARIAFITSIQADRVSSGVGYCISKVAIRNIRRTANDDIKKQKKDNILTEDDVKDAEKAVQDITDKFIKTVDSVTSAKEKEIMKV